jgi:hypothetical protein
MIKARIENNIVKEILDATPFPPFHESLTWIECNKNVQIGWQYKNGIFSAIESNESELLDKKITNIKIQIAELENKCNRALRDIALNNGDIIGNDGKTSKQHLADYDNQISVLRLELQSL